MSTSSTDQTVSEMVAYFEAMIEIHGDWLDGALAALAAHYGFALVAITDK